MELTEASHCIYEVLVIELYIVLLRSKFYLQISHIGTHEREK
jgi:hypothetical protein